MWHDHGTHDDGWASRFSPREPKPSKNNTKGNRRRSLEIPDGALILYNLINCRARHSAKKLSAWMPLWAIIPRPLSADSWREWSARPERNGSIGRSAAAAAAAAAVPPRIIISCWRLSSCCLISCWRCLSLSRSSWSSWRRSCCCSAGEDCERVVGFHAPPTNDEGERCCRCVAGKRIYCYVSTSYNLHTMIFTTSIKRITYSITKKWRLTYSRIEPWRSARLVVYKVHLPFGGLRLFPSLGQWS